MKTHWENAIVVMDELEKLLKKENIPFRRICEKTVVDEKTEMYLYRNQIVAEIKERKISAICHFGSYGYEDGQIEVYNFKEEPIGYLNVEDAFRLVNNYLNYGLFRVY